MASPASKRRKTSPITSLPINAPRTPPHQISPNRAGARSTPNRASFLSPTKASLSRSHPDLLPRAQSEGRQLQGSKGREDFANGIAAGKDATGTRGATADPDDSQVPRVRRSPRGLPNGQIPYGEMSNGGISNGGIGAPPRRRSRTPGGRGSSPAKKAVEITPPPESRPEVAADTQLQRENSQNPKRTEVVDNAALDLPPLLQADPVVSRPPAGLENSPSTRKVRRNKALAERLKSSPLKPRDEPPKQPPAIEERTENERQTQREEPPPTSQREQLPIKEDPILLQKRAMRDELQRQIQGRRRQIEQLEKEILRDQADFNNINPQRSDERRGDRLIALIRPPKAPSKVYEPFSVVAFLPFSARGRRKGRLDAQPSVSSDPIPSHAPITLDDPLPFLRLFTSFTFSSSATILPSASPNDPLIQIHDIRIVSPLSLLNARLSLTVDTTKSKATKLQISSLTPWARRELQTWLTEYAVNKIDITAASWAIQSYWASARKRAKIWCWCEKELSSMVDFDMSGVNGNQAVTKASRGKRNPQTGMNGTDSDDVTGLNGYEPSRRDLSRNLGRQAFNFRRNGVQCRVEWTIAMDWTGEAKSRIGFSIGIPKTMVKEDQRGSLSGIEAVFLQLLKKRGIQGAIKGITGIVYPAS